MFVVPTPPPPSLLPSKLTFPVDVRVLEGLDQSQNLINVPSYWKVVDGDLTKFPFPVNYKQPSEMRDSSTRL